MSDQDDAAAAGWVPIAMATRFPFPMCAKCGVPVARMRYTDNVGTMSRDWSVECHGEIEHTTVSFFDVQDGVTLSGGIAFADQARLAKEGGA